MQTRIQAGQANGVVQQRGHGNTNRFHLGKHVAVVREPTAIELLSGQLPAVGIGVSHPHQLSVFEKTQHTGMVPTHVADTDHTNLHRHHGIGHRLA